MQTEPGDCQREKEFRHEQVDSLRAFRTGGGRTPSCELSLIVFWMSTRILGLAVSTKGKWIMYAQVEPSRSELRLVENFR